MLIPYHYKILIKHQKMDQYERILILIEGPDSVVYQQPTFRYGREPMQDHTCPFCNSLITTKVKKSQGTGAYIGCLGICGAGFFVIGL